MMNKEKLLIKRGEWIIYEIILNYLAKKWRINNKNIPFQLTLKDKLDKLRGHDEVIFYLCQ
jgi:hypothetical protein